MEIPLLALRGITKQFPGCLANDNVDLTIGQHEIHALLGENGAGKSTLVKIIYGVMRPDSGTITWQGAPVTIASPAQARGLGIGMVFQRPNPFPTMSIYDNVASGLRLNGFRNRKLLDEIVERSLRRAALWDEVKDDLKRMSGASISGGQQQRLCIARTLAVDPEVLLMDEPASALDPISTAKIEDLIFQLKSEYTIVIVTHNMQQA
ncbi:MAG: ATP-binding cassette domain-containing protein, partial [Acidocella sp.]|nr:ATP-binding cassette domain-containing protein [Acidocella sp.]